MMVSSKGRYALRVMIYLAQNDREELIPLKEIAENQNISMKYLEMIVSLLHKGNMLISGYCITLPMWQKLDGIIDDYLETVTLEDLLEGRV